jgi:hypothetical protein
VHEIPTSFFLRLLSAVETLLPASGSRSNYSYVFFVDTPRSSRYIAHLRYATIFVLWRIRISVRYTGPHLSTVLRVLAFTDRQSFPAYDRRISELI